jgi:hypothetical protein
MPPTIVHAPRGRDGGFRIGAGGLLKEAGNRSDRERNPASGSQAPTRWDRRTNSSSAYRNGRRHSRRVALLPNASVAAHVAQQRSGARATKSTVCGGFLRALCRTRTGDPFLTINARAASACHRLCGNALQRGVFAGDAPSRCCPPPRSSASTALPHRASCGASRETAGRSPRRAQVLVAQQVARLVGAWRRIAAVTQSVEVRQPRWFFYFARRDTS